MLAIVVLSLLPAKPHSGVSNGQLEHALAYLAAGWLAGLSVQHRKQRVGTFFLLLGLAGLLELTQLLLSGRHAQWLDFLAGASAAAAGVTLSSGLAGRLHAGAARLSRNTGRALPSRATAIALRSDADPALCHAVVPGETVAGRRANRA
jgi:hypothetical protein